MKKKQIRTVLALLLALLMAVGGVACKGKGGKGGETSAETSGADAADAVYWLDVLSAAGTACRVYYPTDAETETVDAAQLLATYIASVSGQSVKAEADSSIPEQPGAMILVGQTCRPESTAFYSSLRYSDYGHAVVGNNVLCIGGYTSANTTKAAKALSKLLTQAQLKSEKTLADGTTETGGRYLSSEQDALTAGSYQITSATLNGHPLSEYVLVYEPSKGKTVAQGLQQLVGVYTGVYLPMKSKNEAQETALEILVGDTGRALTAAFYAQSYSQCYNDYQVLISGEKMALVGASELTLDCALDAFSETYLSASGSLELTAASSLSGVCPSSKRSITDRVSPTDLRVVSNNVYFYKYSLARAALLVESLLYTDADILLLQEVSATWHEYLDKELPGIGYTQVPTKAEDSALGTVTNRQNYTPIFYRADKLTLKEYGYDQFESVKKKPDGSLSSSKSFTWALFEEKATGKSFVCISTHYTWASPETLANELRTSDATEVMAKVAALEKSYACPIIVMGDLNCYRGSDPYKVMESGNLQAARYYADQRVNAVLNTWHELGAEAGIGSGTGILDHCFCSKTKLNAKLFQVIHNTYAVNSTDHLPVALDFTLQ